MRFIAGLIGSPALAVDGGSIIDVFDGKHVTYILGICGSMAACGPLWGPLIGGYAYQNLGWRYSIWTIAWMIGAVLLLMMFCLPETSAEKLLIDKARRMRKETGDERWQSVVGARGSQVNKKTL